MKLPETLRKEKSIIYKTSILSGALFFLSSQLFSQDTIQIIKSSHRIPDSTIVSKKIHASDKDTIPDSTIISKKTDTRVKPPKEKWIPQPERATILSAVLPGLGQAYNRKYWKIPIIYATGGVLYYFYYTNTDNYNMYRRKYEEYKDTDESLANSFKNNYLEYSKKRTYKMIFMGVLYVANIVDAMADAYFVTYDISDDLAFQIRPALLPEPYISSIDFSYGFKLSLHF